MKILQMGAELFHADERTVIYDKANFRDFAYAAKNGITYVHTGIFILQYSLGANHWIAVLLLYPGGNYESK
jgi:hypothetical protein